MEERELSINLHANMKEKAGLSRINVHIPTTCTVAELKTHLKQVYPALAPQLANVVVLIDKQHIILDSEEIPQNAEITFIPPIAGG